jgi:cytochrome bd-type quinol oxidase subunit 2
VVADNPGMSSRVNPPEAPRRVAGADRLLHPAGRASEVGAGIALAVFAIALLLVSLLVVAQGAADTDRGARGSLVVGAILLALGVALLLLSVRLIAGSRRQDGGVLSPTVLRIAGVVFAVLPLLALWFAVARHANEGWMLLLKVGLLASAAVACFRLAAQRARSRRRPDSPID